MPVLKFIHPVATHDRDPEGHRYPWIQSVEDDAGARTPSTGRQPLGIALDTGRLVVPGDRVVFRCSGFDPEGRELRWWVHPFASVPAPQIRGDRVDLTWVVEPVSAGPKVYVAIGMAAQSRHHRQGGLHSQGYDGWVVFYFEVAPATGLSSLRTRCEPAIRPENRSLRSPTRSLLVDTSDAARGRPWQRR